MDCNEDLHAATYAVTLGTVGTGAYFANAIPSGSRPAFTRSFTARLSGSSATTTSDCVAATYAVLPSGVNFSRFAKVVVVATVRMTEPPCGSMMLIPPFGARDATHSSPPSGARS